MATVGKLRPKTVLRNVPVARVLLKSLKHVSLLRELLGF